MRRTIHKIEPPFERYVISLAPEISDLVIDGKKVKTYRLGKKYDYLKVGDKVKIIDTISREFKANVIITDKYFVAFKDLPIDIQGHERYKSKEEQRRTFNGYYKFTGKQIEDEDKFLVLEFQKV